MPIDTCECLAQSVSFLLVHSTGMLCACSELLIESGGQDIHQVGCIGSNYVR